LAAKGKRGDGQEYNDAPQQAYQDQGILQDAGRPLIAYLV
jgi:hypothetical protein